MSMNRFEALHALGLEENATDDDVRLAYYGLEKAVEAFDFSDAEHIGRQVERMINHASEAKTFLLKARNKTAARKVQSYQERPRGKVSVTPAQEKTTRLHGLERLRTLLVGFLDTQLTHRRTSIFILIGCVVVSFITIRYLRGMPRIVVFCVLAAIAVAGSTLLTGSSKQIRLARGHVEEVDAAIAELRRELGLDPDEKTAEADAVSQLLPDGASVEPVDAEALEGKYLPQQGSEAEASGATGRKRRGWPRKRKRSGEA